MAIATGTALLLSTLIGAGTAAVGQRQASQARKAAIRREDEQLAAAQAEATKLTDAEGVAKEAGELATKRIRRRQTPTVLTSPLGVLGGSPSRKKTLLGA